MSTGLPTTHKHISKFYSPLKFSDNGKFRILHLTDIHEVDPKMDDDENHQIPVDKTAETLNVIEKCLDKANPDLVVFGGDNVNGFWDEMTYEYMVKTIRKIVAPVAKRNIPLAVVFGNHDSEGVEVREHLNREIQMCIYAEYDNLRSTMNDEDVYGCGNCSIPVMSSDGKNVAWNIWCMDSNDYIRDEKYVRDRDGGYGYVHEDQIAWYEKKSAMLKEENGGKNVPSVLFQHIPVLQEYELLNEVSKDTDGALEHNGKYYIPKDGAFSCGVMRECPCPPNTHDEQFKSWVKTGNIKAAFFGHDHINTFTEEVNGIKLIQTIGAGYHTYGKEHGGRLIILDENTDDFYTETILVDRITNTKF